MYLLASWQPENLFDFGLAPPSLGIRNLSGNWWTGARLWTCHWPDIINQLLKGPKQEKSLGKSITCWATPCWVLIYSADQVEGRVKKPTNGNGAAQRENQTNLDGGSGLTFPCYLCLVTFGDIERHARWWFRWEVALSAAASRPTLLAFHQKKSSSNSLTYDDVTVADRMNLLF